MTTSDGFDETIPAPPWQQPPVRRRPSRRRVPITREVIVETGLALLDRDGFDALSMRRIADALDTGAASLYWHVGSKDGLLDLILDRVIGEQEVPEPEPDRWREQIKELARTMRATIARHRDVVRVSLGRIPTGPNGLRYADRALAVFRAGGVPDPLAVSGLQLLMIVVNGFAFEESVNLASPGGGGASPEQAGTMVSAYFASLPAARFPNLTALADEFTKSDRDEAFELLLALFVEGLERHRQRF